MVTAALQTVVEPSDDGWIDKFYSVESQGLILHTELTPEIWGEIGKRLWKKRSGLQWAIGDWIVYGEQREEKWGDKYAQALDATDYDYGTLRNYAWVARTFPVSSRVTELSWSHHNAVATKELTPGQRDTLLMEAKTKGLSRDSVRERVVEVTGKNVTERKSWTASGVTPDTDGVKLTLSELDLPELLRWGSVYCNEPDFTVTVTISYTKQRKGGGQ